MKQYILYQDRPLLDKARVLSIVSVAEGDDIAAVSGVPHNGQE
jgi:hypothetical protein